MALEPENLGNIAGLDTTEPVNTLRQVRDMAGQIRMLKNVLKTTFPGIVQASSVFLENLRAGTLPALFVAGQQVLTTLQGNTYFLLDGTRNLTGLLRQVIATRLGDTTNSIVNFVVSSAQTILGKDLTYAVRFIRFANDSGTTNLGLQLLSIVDNVVIGYIEFADAAVSIIYKGAHSITINAAGVLHDGINILQQIETRGEAWARFITASLAVQKGNTTAYSVVGQLTILRFGRTDAGGLEAGHTVFYGQAWGSGTIVVEDLNGTGVGGTWLLLGVINQDLAPPPSSILYTLALAQRQS